MAMVNDIQHIKLKALGINVLDLQSNGDWKPQAHWKRNNDSNTPCRQVMFPSDMIPRLSGEK